MGEEIIYAFSLFGAFRVYTANKEIILKDKLGKQLTSVFAFILVNHVHPVSKDKLIDTFWGDSENPSNALKYAIYRLRSSLKEIEEFKDVDIIVSSNNAYQINPNLNVSLDIDVFEDNVALGKKNNDINYYKQAFDIYCDSFLTGEEGEWIETDRAYYQTIALEICNTLSLETLKEKDLDNATKYCEKGLGFDELDERLIYTYLQTLIADKKYSKAMSYYKFASKNYYDKLGFKLESTNKGFQEILSRNSDVSSEDVSIDSNDISGPMVVDSQTLNSIVVYLIRNSERYDINAYVLTITFNKKIKDLDKLMNKTLELFEVLFRKNDVLSKINDNQIAILFRVHKQKDIKIIEERIDSRLSKLCNHSDDITYNWRKI